MSRVIITGSGGSGTGFMAAALRACGIRCGHEQVFRNTGGIEWEDFDADSSWLAVPSLPSCTDEYIVHLVRHPLKVARSMVPFFDPDGILGDHEEAWRIQRDVIRRLDNDIFCAHDPVQRFCRYYKLWNEQTERYAQQCLKIESVGVVEIQHLLRVLGRDVDSDTVASALRSVPTNYNTHEAYRDPTIQWSQIEDLREIAERYGYEVPDA